MTTTLHDKALAAAVEAFRKSRTTYVSLLSETLAVESAISAYLSSIGGVVCAREPSAWAWRGPKGGFLADNKKPSWPSTPLHAPIEAGNGGDGWLPIETADKDASSLLLGIVRNGVLEEVHIGGYRYAFNDDEVSCWWSDQCDDEITPTHWMRLTPVSTPSHEGREKA